MSHKNDQDMPILKRISYAILDMIPRRTISEYAENKSIFIQHENVETQVLFQKHCIFAGEKAFYNKHFGMTYGEVEKELSFKMPKTRLQDMQKYSKADEYFVHRYGLTQAEIDKNYNEETQEWLHNKVNKLKDLKF